MTHICILYAVEDQAFAAKIERALRNEGYHPSRREVSGDVRQVIDAPASDPQAVIVIWSQTSIASPAVIADARAALAHRILTPAAIGKIEPPASFDHLWPINLSDWAGNSDDSRWRFVVDEINLSLRRNETGDTEPAAEKRASGRGRRISSQTIILGAAACLAAIAVSAIVFAPYIVGSGGGRLASAETIGDALSDDAKAHSGLPKATAGGLVVAAGDRGATPPEAAAPLVPISNTSTDNIDVVDAGTDGSAPIEAEALQDEGAAKATSIEPVAETPASASVDEVVEEALGSDGSQSADNAAVDASADEREVGALADDNSRSAAPDLEAADLNAGDDVSERSTPNDAISSASDADDAQITQSGAIPFSDCDVCPQMIEVPSGAFDMGAPAGEPARHRDELSVRRVTINQSFAMSVFEVTYLEWRACVEAGACDKAAARDPGWGGARRPVVNVSYTDATAYAAWLTGKTGRTYRLPSEAEWEYAARAGESAPFAFGKTINPQQANYNGRFSYGGGVGVNRGKTVPVGSFAPNAFGLYDMHGNVWEWTSDCWSGAGCGQRVLKGGAWNTGGWRLRAGHRIKGSADRRDYDNGFRLVRELNEDAS